MRVLLITFVAASLACSTQAVFCTEVRHTLAGRWELISIDMPIALRRGDSIVIDGGTISIRSDCNEVKLVYSTKDDELTATPLTTTSVACYPSDRFADEDRLVYGAVLHSRYQIDGNLLRLFSPKDSPFDYTLRFRRVE